MRLSTVTILASLVLVAASTNVHAATLRVPAQHATVQAAINAAVAGDTVLVAAGTYRENLIFYGKAITVISKSGPEVTILDGGSLGAVVTFTSGEGLNSILSGFTIRNGSSSFGSGISVQFSAATIVSNIFTNNVAPSGYFGAGIAGFSANVVIEKNVFRNNRTDNQSLAGVVTFVNASSPRIANNLFYDNLSRAIVIDLPSDRSAVVINNTIVGNEGGIKVNNNIDTTAQLYFNNLIVSNKVGLQTVSSLPPTWANNLVAGNQTDYVGSTNQTGVNGNIGSAPLFACPETSNFRLVGVSPGLNAGTNSFPHLPATDFDGRPRVVAGVVDVGAFEFDPLTAVTSCAPATLRVPTQYTNIQTAINAATAGDVVLVAPGTYAENINFMGKAITVISEAGPEATILDGQRAGAVITFESGETRSSVLGGFTIRNGSSYNGSGVSLWASSATIVSNIFENNDAPVGGTGGAVGGSGASPTIEQNVFRHNSTDGQFSAGVVAFINLSSPRIANNVFYDNRAQVINVNGPPGSSPVVINNTIVRNYLAIRVDGRIDASEILFFNNIVVGNTIGLSVDFGSPPTWVNNLVGGNQTDYRGIPNQAGTNGNISGAPVFVCINTRDFRLRPGSLGIDAGNNSAPQLPTTDFDGRNRILVAPSNGPAIVDLGAFEFDPVTPVPSCPGPEVFCWNNSITTNCGMSVTLGASVTQFEGEVLSVTWRVNGSVAQETIVEALPFPSTNTLWFTKTFPGGTNLVEVTVADSTTNVSCSTAVVVRDSIPPLIECPTNQVVDMTNVQGAPAFFTINATDLCSSVVEVVSDPPSGYLFLLGTSAVTCVAKDSSGNNSRCSFLVTVLGPREIKSTVLTEVISYAVSHSNELRSFDRATAHLRRAIEPERWRDETRLRSKGASRVFLDDAATVRQLQHLLRTRRFIPVNDPLLQWVRRLAQSDRTLAVLSIESAAKNDAGPHLLAKAARRLARGDKAREKGEFAKAILHYYHAWRPVDRFVDKLETHE